MRFKYKATYDAGLDTFRIEYLLAGSAVLSLTTSYIYTVVEVKKERIKVKNVNMLIKKKQIDFMVFFNLVRSSCYFTTIIHVAKNRGG